jgi:hypothetical protein
MVTGDNKDAAIAIAKEAGILPQDWQPVEHGLDTTVMEGKSFQEFVGGLYREALKPLGTLRTSGKLPRTSKYWPAPPRTTSTSLS